MSTKGKMARAVFAMLLAARIGWADSGVLIPLDKQAPDPSILSLTEMRVEIRIDNGDARVWVRQIFANHTEKIEEGNYVFALPLSHRDNLAMGVSPIDNLSGPASVLSPSDFDKRLLSGPTSPPQPTFSRASSAERST